MRQLGVAAVACLALASCGQGHPDLESGEDTGRARAAVAPVPDVEAPLPDAPADSVDGLLDWLGSGGELGQGYCVGESYCDSHQCYAPDHPLSVSHCSCEALSGATDDCDEGSCVGDSWCQAPTCPLPVCYGPDHPMSVTRCGRCSDFGHCDGDALCVGGDCLAPELPLSRAACACGLIDPSCGVGECVGDVYCTGMACATPVCYASWDPVSLALCGGIPLSDCSVDCTAPPSGMVAWWPFDEAEGSTVWTSAFNPDGAVPPLAAGPPPSAFDEATQYVPPQHDVTSIVFDEEWTGIAVATTPTLVAVELFDADAGSWVVAGSTTLPALTVLPFGGLQLDVPPIPLVTAVRFTSVPAQGPTFQSFGGGTFSLRGKGPIRAKDIVGGSHGTLSDTLRYFGPKGPVGPGKALGMVGTALAFDGLGDVVIAPLRRENDTPRSHATNELTLDAWIRPSALAAAPRALVQFRYAGTGEYELALVQGNLRFTHHHAPGSFTGATTTNPIAANTWSHVAVTASVAAGEVVFYVNGSAVQTLPYGFPLGAPEAGTWQIGSSAAPGAPGPSFFGAIDEVEVFERALWAFEIEDLAAAGPSGKCKQGLILTEPVNGQVLPGATLGHLVPVSGFARVPGQPITVEAYHPGTSAWQSVGATTSALTPDLNGLYPWFVSVTPEPSAGTDRWKETGVAWLRATTVNGTEATTVDDPTCVTRHASGPPLQLVADCRGGGPPRATIIDPDTRPDTLPMSSLHYLGRKYDSAADPAAYYAQVDAGPGQMRSTLPGWKQVNGFPADEVGAVYFNAGDLRIGRQMHCREVKACDIPAGQPMHCEPADFRCNTRVRVACYVTNFFTNGFGPGGPAEGALANAIADTNAVATVSMEYLDVSHAPFAFDCNGLTLPAPPPQNRVRFYVHDNVAWGQPLLGAVPLDSEGAKLVPVVCLTCHGGTWDGASSAVTDARFLPFDVGSFLYSSDAGYTLPAQSEAFRKLNGLVASTLPASHPIRDLIDGFYKRQDAVGATIATVSTPGNPHNDRYVPQGWIGGEPAYHAVVQPYCRGCHLAQGPGVHWLSFDAFRSSVPENAACTTPSMPQAEVPFEHFYRHGARAELTNSAWKFAACAP